jgi:hypothetical protein
MPKQSSTKITLREAQISNKNTKTHSSTNTPSNVRYTQKNSSQQKQTKENSTKRTTHGARSSFPALKAGRVCAPCDGAPVSSPICSLQTAQCQRKTKSKKTKKVTKFLYIDLYDIYTALSVWSLNPCGWEFVAIARPREAIAMAKSKLPIPESHNPKQLANILDKSLTLQVFPARENPNNCRKELSVSLEKIKTSLKKEVGKRENNWERYLNSLFV